MSDLLKTIAGIFTTGPGAIVGGWVTNIAALTALVAALSPIALAVLGHKDDVFITVTVGELFFWIGMGSGVFLFALKIAHYTRSPGQP